MDEALINPSRNHAYVLPSPEDLARQLQDGAGLTEAHKAIWANCSENNSKYEKSKYKKFQRIKNAPNCERLWSATIHETYGWKRRI
jgi:hypothetical protein